MTLTKNNKKDNTSLLKLKLTKVNLLIIKHLLSKPLSKLKFFIILYAYAHVVKRARGIYYFFYIPMGYNKKNRYTKEKGYGQIFNVKFMPVFGNLATLQRFPLRGVLLPNSHDEKGRVIYG